MEQTIYFEDYEIGSVRESIGRTITETDIVIHAGQTGDFFPHHMDAEFAKTTEFGRRIAHGTLTFSVAVGMTANLINPAAFSYGYDRLRFINPVFIGAEGKEREPKASRARICDRGAGGVQPGRETGASMRACDVLFEEGVLLKSSNRFIVDVQNNPASDTTITSPCSFKNNTIGFTWIQNRINEHLRKSKKNTTS